MKMAHYGYNEGDRQDPRWYENRPEMLERDTATVWTMHMKVDGDELDALLSVLGTIPEATGEYAYGDSWEQWGEKTEDPNDKHLAFYFRANRANAEATHEAMKALIEARFGVPFAVTTYVSAAGDWAEQLEPSQPKGTSA